MIASIGNSYTPGIFARSTAGRSIAAPFDTSFSSAAVGQTDSSPGVDLASTASAGDTNAPDFTSMTRQQLRDWTNDQITSGKMRFDDGSALALMFGKVPVDGTARDDETLAEEKVNFIDLARNGIAGAQSRGDQNAVAMLQKALTIMRDSQAPGKAEDLSTAESSVTLKEALAAFEKGATARPNQPAV